MNDSQQRTFKAEVLDDTEKRLNDRYLLIRNNKWWAFLGGLAAFAVAVGVISYKSASAAVADPAVKAAKQSVINAGKEVARDLGVFKANVAESGKINERLKRLEGQATVPIGGIIMWWGNWKDEKTRPSDYEVCDGTAVTTPGQLFQHLKPDFLNRFPKGAPQNLYNDEFPSVVGGQDVVHITHHHTIASQALSSKDLWIPFGRINNAIYWTDTSVAGGSRGSFSPDGARQRENTGKLPESRGIGGTVVNGSIPLPELTTSDETQNVETVPQFQQVLFLIRVR